MSVCATPTKSVSVRLPVSAALALARVAPGHGPTRQVPRPPSAALRSGPPNASPPKGSRALRRGQTGTLLPRIRPFSQPAAPLPSSRAVRVEDACHARESSSRYRGHAPLPDPAPPHRSNHSCAQAGPRTSRPRSRQSLVYRPAFLGLRPPRTAAVTESRPMAVHPRTYVAEAHCTLTSPLHNPLRACIGTRSRMLPRTIIHACPACPPPTSRSSSFAPGVSEPASLRDLIWATAGVEPSGSPL
ncbi:hypothetical protein C8Q80DRAFT_137437 [Daedaleopsis nitida]|nr:hypothetical protein C8Q80DRAFT_137437 [Daedaleopsis nitida]